MNENLSIIERIFQIYDSLSRQQKKIADYITAHLDEVIFISVSNFASTLNVSEATIVRFAQLLDYSGFPELREDLITYYKVVLTPSEKLQRYLRDVKEDESLYQTVTRKEITYLIDSMRDVDEQVFIDTVERICHAETVYIFGSGPNESLANYLASRLWRFKLKTIQVSVLGNDLLEKLLLATPRDFVIVYWFYKPSLDFKKLMAFLNDRELRNLLITDTQSPPMIEDAHMVLYAQRGPFGAFHSMIVPMAITNAIIIGVANSLRERAIEPLKELNEIRKKYAFYKV
ncbi:MAG: MurR/RpiR family transcriptional regulator [bacterium]|nr:MurR/RpiR family transcriptional regulator [bacterium]